MLNLKASVDREYDLFIGDVKVATIGFHRRSRNNQLMVDLDIPPDVIFKHRRVGLPPLEEKKAPAPAGPLRDRVRRSISEQA